MKTVEKVELTDQEHADYMRACKELNRSMRCQTTMLIREFLKRDYYLTSLTIDGHEYHIVSDLNEKSDKLTFYKRSSSGCL